MPLIRGRKRKAPIVDISDSSSQASEDNVPPTEPPKKNRVVLHYAAENPDKPDAKMNGQYGMFSQCSPLSPSAPIKTPAKRKRVTIDKRASGGSGKQAAAETLAENETPERDGITREEREESPLFEPEHGGQEDADTDIDMLGPLSTPAFNTHMPSRKGVESVTVITRGSRRKRPIVVESGSSSSESDADCDTSPHVAVTYNPNPNPNSRSHEILLTASPLPGNVSLIDDYIEILNDLASHASKTSAHEQIINEYANEEALISLAIEGLPIEEERHLATIAQACAKGIQADMATPSIATNMSAIQAAIEDRQKEAEISRQGVPGLMAKREEELQARRREVCHKREAALEKWNGEVRLDIMSLEEKKKRLEKEGGMAMAIELGRRMERSEGAKAKRHW